MFDGLTARHRDAIARAFDEFTVPPGTRLATIGETGNEMYVIVTGEARVTTGRGRVIRLSAGDFFGEMSLLDGGPRSATVDAPTELSVLTLGRRELWGGCWIRRRRSCAA